LAKQCGSSGVASGMVLLHVVEELLSLLVISFKDSVDILLNGLLPDLLLARLNLDFFIVNILLEPPHVVIPCMEVIRPRKP
jgi:hypothetical protein